MTTSEKEVEEENKKMQKYATKLKDVIEVEDKAEAKSLLVEEDFI